MGWSVSNDQPDVAPELGTLDPVFRLSGRHSQSDLHHQRGGVAEYVATQGDQDPGIVSQFGSRYETAVPGLEHIAKKWTMPVQNWKAALQRFAILLGDRVPKTELA